MASNGTIAHRFANKLEGKNGRISAGNVRYEGRNYFSYSTVFGQWLDIEKDVVAIFDGDTSISSSKHKLWKGVFPDDVHVFPLDFSSNSYYGWRNCNLVSEYNFNDEDFKEHHRMQMIDHYVGRIYDQLAAINGGTKNGLENVDFKAWDYIEELCSLYKDTSVNKYLKWTENKDYKKLVKMLKDGERNVETLTDALFGDGTYKTYWDYCARYRKQSDKRAKMEQLCHRLGIGSPYVQYRGYRCMMSHEMTADQIRKLTAKERVELHFKALAYKEYEKHEKERKAKRLRNEVNAYTYITGFVPKMKKNWRGDVDDYEDYVYECRNMYTGDVYHLGDWNIDFRVYEMEQNIKFCYKSFAKSADKQAWIDAFYAKCAEVDRNLQALSVFNRINAHYEEIGGRFGDHKYLDDDYLKENTTADEYAVCKDFITRWDAIIEDKEARRRAAEIARIKAEEERKREEEFKAQVKQEQIDECIKEGTEGCRNLWRKHLTSIGESEERYDEVSFNSDEDFFYNGNVLLRLNLNKDKVETSKNIRIPVDICKKMWKIVSRWHENQSCFKPMQIDTKGSGRYTISSYQNDILTAGCHKIAYNEMERMYNEIQGL